MEFVEFHEVIGGVFKEAILEKNFSKSKPFKYFSKWFGTCTKTMAIKIFRVVCQLVFNFDNFAVLYFLVGKIFGSLWHTVR